MNEMITEKNYPIQIVWRMRHLVIPVVLLIALIIFGLFFLIRDNDIITITSLAYPIGFLIFSAVFFFLWVVSFQFSIEDKHITLKQGILSKRERHIPYGTIQNLLIEQDILDRILGLASLTIENASQGAGNTNKINGPKFLGISIFKQSQKDEGTVGFTGNKVSIPGLNKLDAEKLKEIILRKMKENPIEDSQSGL